MKSFRYQVSSKEAGMNLLSFLREKCKEAPSVKAIKRAIDSKKCTINGRVEYFSTFSMRQGDLVEIELFYPTVQNKPLVLFEDDFLIAYDKPPGLVSKAESFDSSLKLVHRLDKETSGAILLAKNDEIEQRLIALFSERKIEKLYLAIVDGTLSESEEKIESYLYLKHRYEGGAIYGSSKEKKGKNALTYWKCLKSTKNASLLLCSPITGRTHQLRVQLKERGHPILGDWQYAKNFSQSFKPERVLLHAFSISFTHPVMQQKQLISSPLPQDFLQALKTLQLEIDLHEITHCQNFIHR